MQDADAFAALYDREAQAVLVFIARRTLDAELALDLTAETFAHAFRGRRSFRGSTEMEERAWLYAIARRQIALRTPRDVRTLRPVGGVFLAVYDGAFYGGSIVATARLRDGRTVTQRIPASRG